MQEIKDENNENVMGMRRIYFYFLQFLINFSTENEENIVNNSSFLTTDNVFRNLFL